MDKESFEKSVDSILEPFADLIGGKQDTITLVPKNIPTKGALSDLIRGHAYSLLLKESLTVQEVELLKALLGCVRIGGDQ